MSDDIFASANYAAGRARFIEPDVEPDKATPAKAAPSLFGTAKTQAAKMAADGLPEYNDCLTPDQNFRHRLGLPYEGRQPAVLALRTYKNLKSGRAYFHDYDENFVLDGRWPYKQREMLGFCTVHATEIVMRHPSVCVDIHTVPEIGPSGYFIGHRDLVSCVPENLRHLRDRYIDKRIGALALSIYGDSKVEPIDYYGVNFLEINASLSLRFRDAEPPKTIIRQASPHRL